MFHDKVGRNFLPADQGFRAVRSHPLARDGGGVQLLKLGSGEPDQSILLQQAVLFLKEQQLALVEKGDIVAYLFQVADDMGREDHGVVFLAGEVQQNIQDFLPHHRVQAAGGLVQQQELGPVGQRHGQGQLHLHAPGEVLEALLPGQGEPVHIAGVGVLIPAGVGLGHHLAHLPGVEDLREVGLVQHHADVVFQFPEGVTWGDGQVAYVAIGIAASSDEHLGLLRQLTHVLSDDSVAEQLKSATTAEELRALLMGEKQSEQLKLDNEMLTLDIVASDLLTLQALNAARLKEAGAVDATFVTKAINEQPLNLGQGIWLSDSAEGNLRSAIAVSRAANAFDVDGETAAMLVSVAMNDDQPIAVLKRLADLLLDNKADRLLKADAATLLALLTSDDAPTDDVLSAEFVVRNEHGQVPCWSIPLNNLTVILP